MRMEKDEVIAVHRNIPLRRGDNLPNCYFPPKVREVIKIMPASFAAATRRARSLNKFTIHRDPNDNRILGLVEFDTNAFNSREFLFSTRFARNDAK